MFCWRALSRSSPQRGFRNQMRGIHKSEHFTHEPCRFELREHGGKQLGEPSRPYPGMNACHETIVERGHRRHEAAEPFGRSIFFEIPGQVMTGEVFQVWQQKTVKQPFGFIAVRPFDADDFREGLLDIRQILLDPAVGMGRRSHTVKSNHCP